MQAPTGRGRRTGFTLIELLIVILILAILMAVALPLYLAAVNKSEVTTCRANLWSIAQAEQAYKTRSTGHTYTTNVTDLNVDLGHSPVCPRSGVYSVVISDGTQLANNGLPVPAGGVIIQCSVAGHGVFAPSLDSE